MSNAFWKDLGVVWLAEAAFHQVVAEPGAPPPSQPIGDSFPFRASGFVGCSRCPPDRISICHHDRSWVELVMLHQTGLLIPAIRIEARRYRE
jgi:hypothetical protein